MDVSPKQVVSVATALIPFLEHDDANRALMAPTCSAKPCVAAGRGPLVAPASRSGLPTTRATPSGRRSRRGGRGDRRPHRGPVPPAPRLSAQEFVRSNQGTCINQKPLIRKARGSARRRACRRPSTDAGSWPWAQPAGGLMPWRGHNYEDAIVVSERLVKEDLLTSIHIEEYEIEPATPSSGRGDHPRHPQRGREACATSTSRASCASGRGRPGRLPRGKVTPKGETELTPKSGCCGPSSARRPARCATCPSSPPRRVGQGHRRQDLRREDGDELPPA